MTWRHCRTCPYSLCRTDGVEGGETNLPLADPIDEKLQAIENPSPCAARMGLSVRPRKVRHCLSYLSSVGPFLRCFGGSQDPGNTTLALSPIGLKSNAAVAVGHHPLCALAC